MTLMKRLNTEKYKLLSTKLITSIENEFCINIMRVEGSE